MQLLYNAVIKVACILLGHSLCNMQYSKHSCSTVFSMIMHTSLQLLDSGKIVEHTTSSKKTIILAQ